MLLVEWSVVQISAVDFSATNFLVTLYFAFTHSLRYKNYDLEGQSGKCKKTFMKVSDLRYFMGLVELGRVNVKYDLTSSTGFLLLECISRYTKCGANYIFFVRDTITNLNWFGQVKFSLLRETCSL